jgi:peptide/nickel transport system permease protein
MSNETIAGSSSASSPRPTAGAVSSDDGTFPLRRSRFSTIFKSLGLIRESKVGMIGLALVLFWIAMAVLAPVLPLFPPNKPLAVSIAPFTTVADGATYWLGTDHKGRDVLSRLIWGSQLVLLWSTLATIVAYSVGILFGVIAGYLSGWWDEVISFVANVLLSFPVMVLYLVIINYLGASGLNVIIAVTFATGPAIMRIVRGLVLDLKTRDYVAAAQVRGEHPLYIMLVELLPNARGPLIVDVCLRLGYITITIALLGYLGIGLPPPDPDWGKMIAEAQALGARGINGAIWPAIAISTLVLGLNLLADGLREISLRD